jgi:Ca2+-binding EF-hand superfamily protein
MPAGTSSVRPKSNTRGKGGLYDKNHTGPIKSPNQILSEVRYQILRRGTQGINGVKRCFRQMDEDSSNTLSLREFIKALEDYRIYINPEQQSTIFRLFDQDGNGEINYEEFIFGVVGQMNKRRECVVMAAFSKLDIDNSGTLQIDEVKSTYNAKAHPDVASGKKTEDDALYEFLDSFDQHLITSKDSLKDRSVSLKEFVDYYNCVSCSIESDYEFEQAVALTWGLI